MGVVVPAAGSRGLRPPRMLSAALSGVGPFMYRLLGNRMKVQGQPVLLLKTRGAKTGRPRETIVCRFPNGDRTDSWLVVASAAGAARHPAWFVNIAKHPESVSVEIAGRAIKVTPESVVGPEREAAWKRIVELAPGFAKYPQQTDREIPIVRLTAG